MSGKDRPGGTAPTVSAESLLAELAAARQAGARGQLAPPPEERETRRKSGSALLVFGAVAVVLFVVITMSPLRNRVPGVDRAGYAFEQFLDRYATIIR